MTRFVIAGGGIAAMRAAETIRDLRSDDPVTLVAEEERPFYMRPLLADFVADRIEEKDLWIGFESKAASKKIDLALGVKVVGLDYRRERDVVLSDGRNLPHDMLLIATGVKPVMPNIPGADLDGVTTFSTYADAVKIKAWAAEAKTAVVYGHGLPALELVRALRFRELQVTLIVPDDKPWFLPLFDTKEEEIEKVLAQHEVNLAILDEPVELTGSSGKVEMVKTREGRELRADIVGIAAEQRPRLEFLAGTDIPAEQGILTDEHLRTGDERVYAAGDVAQIQTHDSPRTRFRALGYGWMRAGSHGEVAGRNMCGQTVTVEVGDEYQAESLYGVSLPARWR